MELSFSPDIDARYCYSIVFLLGMFTAFRLVNARVEAFSGAWSVPRTWLVWLVFFPVPLLLFWLFDRLSVLNDTSVFGAVLVGAAYDRILAGGVSAVKSPGELTGVWKVLSTWADGIRDVVLARTSRDSDRFDAHVVRGLIEDDAKLEAITDLALVQTTDLPKLQAQLEEFDENASELPENVLRERRARYLFEEVGMQPDFHHLMYTHGLIGWWPYRQYTWNLASWRIGLPILVLVVAVPGFGVPFLTEPSTEIAYHVWRIQKPNATALDRHRASRELAAYLHDGGDAAARETARSSLQAALLKPAMPVDRVDAILALLIETRDATGIAEAAEGLVPCLRASSVDARARVHRTLLFLARESLGGAADTAPLSKLAAWSAKDHESSTQIESHIEEWNAFWEERRPPDSKESAQGD